MQATQDALDVIFCIQRYMSAADHRDWAAARSCFADEVYLDYTDLRPNPPAGMIAADTMIAGWAERHAAILAYHHHMGNLLPSVDGDTARCTASGLATHLRGSASGGTEFWQLGAYYDYELERANGRWVITSVTIHKQWERTAPA